MMLNRVAGPTSMVDRSRKADGNIARARTKSTTLTSAHLVPVAGLSRDLRAIFNGSLALLAGSFLFRSWNQFRTIGDAIPFGGLVAQGMSWAATSGLPRFHERSGRRLSYWAALSTLAAVLGRSAVGNALTWPFQDFRRVGLEADRVGGSL